LAETSTETFGIGMGERNHTENIMNGIKLSVNNYNVSILQNEISGIRSDTIAYGIKIEEPLNTNVINFINRDFDLLGIIAARYEEHTRPMTLREPTTQKYTIANNIIHTIGTINDEAFPRVARVGVALSPRQYDRALTAITIPQDENIKRVLIANNTIYLSDEGATRTDDETTLHNTGILIGNVENYEIINNAIQLNFNTNNHYQHISALTLVSRNPKHQANKININHNAYNITGMNGSYSRFFELDRHNRLIDDGGTVTEFARFRN
jgi:hypothetical protein